MPCTGTVICDDYEPDSGLCEFCGCIWESGDCFGNPDACSTHNNQFDCEECLCDWAEPSTNVQINIGDEWRQVDEVYINIGDVWKTVIEIWENIADVWKRIF